MTTKKLSELKVLDASTVIAGPLVGGLLGDIGADVIKVEQPGAGDPSRSYEPSSQDVSLSFKVTNRNKRSITLDLRETAGQQVFYRLAKKADIVIFNFRPETLKAWNIDYEDLRQHNDNIIMLHLTAFGRTGPYANKPGFARIAESFAGLTYITGDTDRNPLFTGYPLADGIAGYFAAFSIMTALQHRNASGEGQLIDLALYEPVLRMMEDFVIGYGENGVVKERMGNSQAHVVPNNVYPTKDGAYIVLPVSTARMWERLTKLIGDDELTAYKTNQQRLSARGAVDAKIAEFTRSVDQEELLDLLEGAGLAASKINTVADIFSDEHIHARKNLLRIYDEELDSDVVMQAPIPQYSTIENQVRSTGPTLGAHTEEILRSVGYQPTEITKLREANVV